MSELEILLALGIFAKPEAIVQEADNHELIVDVIVQRI